MAKAALCRDIPSTLGIPACKQLPSGPCSMASQAVRRRRHTTLVTHGPRKLSALVSFRVFSKTDGLEAFSNCRYLVCRRRNFLLHGGCYGEEAGSGKWTYLAQDQRASKTICDVREGSRCVPRYQGDLASHRASIAGGFVDGRSGDHHLVARLSAPTAGSKLRSEPGETASVSLALEVMSQLKQAHVAAPQHGASIFTIVGGTTIPERARIVKAHCHEGSVVELRRELLDPTSGLAIGVWLECPSPLRLISLWKKIGHVPAETADALEPFMDESSKVVARGIVRSVYAPRGREEAAVTVHIQPFREAPV